MSILKNLDNPNKFYDLIPRTLRDNLRFRKELHSSLESDKGAQEAFLALLRIDPKIAYNALFFTFNPRNQRGMRNVPFILRETQAEAVDALHDGFENRYDITIDKARDEGATEIVTKYIALMCRVEEQVMALVGSRKAEFVDNRVNLSADCSELSGDHKSLFHKICYTYNTSPQWFRPRVLKNYMHLEICDTGSYINGEATNDNFGAGDRRTILFIDEIGRVEHSVARSIIGSVSDTCDFNIFCSTHWYGPEHPYNELLTTNSSKVIVLPWEKNPDKKPGMYRSPDHGKIEIKDIEYYRGICHEIFDYVQPNEVFDLMELKRNVEKTRPDLLSVFDKISFVADGGDFNDGGWRSAWYDREVIRRRHNRRDIARNIDRNPMGSGNNFFSIIHLRRARIETVIPPIHRGSFHFEKSADEKILPGSCRINDGVPGGPLKIFTHLVSGRLRSDRNYIVAVDVSRGTGASNSVANILDANTCEQVGIFTSPNYPPEAFGDLVVGLLHWIGWERTFLIWEANGPGQAFEKRILFHGFTNFYIPRDERARHKKRQNKRGWWSTPGPNGTKYSMLEDLDIALSQGLRGSKHQLKVTLRDEETVAEMERYIQYENGSLGPSDSIEDSVGARATHGDRVIAIGLGVFALKYQRPQKEKEEPLKYPKDCIYATLKRIKDNERKEKENFKFWYHRCLN